MFTNLLTCDLLVRMLRSWGKIQTNQHRSRSMCTRAAEGEILSLSLSHAGEACANARTKMHIFRGMHTNLGTFDQLVPMLRSWGKIQVNQHRSRSMCTRAAERAILPLTITRRGSMHKCAHAYTHIRRYLH